MVTGESDGWADDDDVALHSLSAIEHYATCTIETSSEVWKFRGPPHLVRRGLSSNASSKFFTSDNFRLRPS